MTKVLRTHLTNVKNEVEILQKDPNSPLYSAKTFEELNLYVLLFGQILFIKFCLDQGSPTSGPSYK